MYPYIYMRGLRLVGSLKIYISFAKEPYKREYILQKRPIFLCSAEETNILRSLLIVAFWFGIRMRIECIYPYIYMRWLRLVFFFRERCHEFENTLCLGKQDNNQYGVATISRLPNNMRLFCKRAL